MCFCCHCCWFLDCVWFVGVPSFCCLFSVLVSTWPFGALINYVVKKNKKKMVQILNVFIKSIHYMLLLLKESNYAFVLVFFSS